MTPERELARLLADLRPEAHPGAYVFAVVPEPGPVIADAIAIVREPEGVTVVLPARPPSATRCPSPALRAASTVASAEGSPGRQSSR